LIEAIGWGLAILFLCMFVSLKWIRPRIIAKKQCHVCGYPIGKTRRVLADGEYYHYDCWLKMYKREILDT